MAKGIGRTVDANRFAMVPRGDIPRSAIDVVHSHKSTIGAQYLIPVYVREVLPGDSVRCKMHAFARLAPMLVPPMDNLYFESFFFFVPNRLVWSNWERFMGEQASPSDSQDYVVPRIELTRAEVSTVTTLYDYMGLTCNGVSDATVVAFNALPFRAYYLIWNDWFRDEDLQTPLTVPTGDGPDGAYVLQSRGKRHDYFTSARPWPQKPIMQAAVGGFTAGDELRELAPGRDFSFTQYNNVNVIGAPVTGIGYVSTATTTPGPETVKSGGGRTEIYSPYYSTSGLRVRSPQTDGTPDIKVLVNDIRTAMMFQAWQERNARGGTRYAELLASHFGVRNPDARLQRPEYLGGGRTMIGTQPVTQTSASGLTGSTTALGNLSANATVQAFDHGFSQSFTEHGFVLGLVNVRADLTYQQGVERMWFRKSRFDFYWPGFAHLGEQAVFSKEIFHDGTSGDDTVFGYQERWAEYKYKPSRVSGLFRSSSPAPLDMWHWAQQFNPRPTLNSGFINDVPPLSRNLQVGGPYGALILADFMFEDRVVTAMPMYSIPGVGSRF